MCNLYTYGMTAENMRLLKAHYNLIGREYLDVLQTRNDETKMYPNYEGPVILERVRHARAGDRTYALGHAGT
jgi:hypothetical protein